jgi:hypothetical protein
MFATIYHNYHTYVYKAERWRTGPYTVIAFSVNRYVSLTVFHELTPLPTHHIVTATRDCGRVTAILYSRLATRLRSLAIILPIHLFTITLVHVCNRIPLITIRTPTGPNAGVRALTLLSLFQ